METLRNVLNLLHQHPLSPLLVGAAMCALLAQVYKWAVRALGYRHHDVVERTLPLVPAAIGVVLFGVWPHEFAVPALLHESTEWSVHSIGGPLGAGIGFSAGGVFRAVLAWVDSETLRKSFTLPDESD